MKDKKLFKIINSIPGFDDKYKFISFIEIDSITS